MSISTQAMTAAGENFTYSRKAAPPSSFGPMKVVKNEPFTDENGLAQIYDRNEDDEIIQRKILHMIRKHQRNNQDDN